VRRAAHFVRNLPAVPASPESARGERLSRLGSRGISLRRHTARGTLINSGFQVGLAALSLVQRLAAAAFLTQAEFGLWAIILTVLVTLAWLKQLGIPDKFIQQSEPDQELAFQRAFTLELLSSIGYFAIIALALPVYAVAYGHDEMIIPGIVCALSVPVNAFAAPSWIPYRRADYVRYRVLITVNPVVSFLLTIMLGAAGFGYWCFVLGILGGSIAGAFVCWASSPYRMRLRWDRSTVRSYVSFSWPLLGNGLSRLLVVQGSLLAANRSVGLAGIAAIGLATGIATFADRVDQVVSQTIYPTVCAVRDRAELMFETFVKSNRVALMWAMPFGVGLALFSEDLITLLFDDRWQSAAGILGAIGLISAFSQVAFNWTVFLRATDNTRPLFVSGVVNVVMFAAVSLPAILILGLWGWVVGIGATAAAQLVLRAIYMRRLFPGFDVLRQLARSVAPTVPATVLVLAIRAAAPSSSPAVAVIEVVLYASAVVLSTIVFERRLVAELAGYLGVRRPLIVRHAAREA
jgi:PST family polysaccharide transporter